MIKAGLIVDRAFPIADLDRRVFGTFVEHMGRCVYGGIYEPGHPTADANGLRGDVLALTRELGTTIVRYPGGNFLSGYNWEDGVGPVADRPRRLDLAWMSTETNQFGTHEFMAWCREANVEPMLGVNLGTRDADAARRYVEYVNHPGGTELSEQRRANGADEPFGVKFWCLGNEMDGPWQICGKTAQEYGRLAHEAAKVMRWVDPSVELAACGSSHREMTTYAAWEYEVLEHCFDDVEYLSLHTYFTNPTDDTTDFFATIERMDMFIKEVVAICDAVAARRRSPKRIMLSFDEWNVWYKARGHAHQFKPGWPEAPKLIEEVYEHQDALVVGGALITLLNNADRVRVACLAQLVNVIGPIMTETGGPAWRQTIFHPFAMAARHAHGRVLRPVIASPTYATDSLPGSTYLLAAVTDDEANGRATVFALNRHLDSDMELTVELRGMGGTVRVESAEQLHHTNLRATNTRDAPDAVSPTPLAGVTVDGSTLRATLRPGSWNVITVSLG